MLIPNLKQLWEYPEHWAEKYPDLPIIRFKKKTITNKEFNEASDQLAKAFLSMGLKKCDTIVTMLPTIPEYILTFIAASKIGAITIPMDINYKKADLIRLIPHSNPKIIVSINKFGKTRISDMLKELSLEFGDIKYVIVGNSNFGISFEEILEKNYDLDKELSDTKKSQNEDEDILVIWTGGTTGIPKAVFLNIKK